MGTPVSLFWFLVTVVNAVHAYPLGYHAKEDSNNTKNANTKQTTTGGDITPTDTAHPPKIEYVPSP